MTLIKVNKHKSYLLARIDSTFMIFRGVMLTEKMYNFIGKLSLQNIKDLNELLKNDGSGKSDFQIELTKFGYKENTESYTYKIA